jgi:hypothetical protein
MQMHGDATARQIKGVLNAVMTMMVYGLTLLTKQHDPTGVVGVAIATIIKAAPQLLNGEQYNTLKVAPMPL